MKFQNGFKGRKQNSMVFKFGEAPWRMEQESLPFNEGNSLALEDIHVYQNGPWVDNDAGSFFGNYLISKPYVQNNAATALIHTPIANVVRQGKTPPADGFFDENPAKP